MTTLSIEKTPAKMEKQSFNSLDDLFWYCVTNNLLTKPASKEEIDHDPILSAAKDAEESDTIFNSASDLINDLIA